ncbi:hypothetical protein [Bacteroides sp.]|uniref:hypothetical protein n=1 Tax=Bacteroides sp. TaxID=29523 RepID=UPI002618128C|nr:hypothetical protein [Bacteroides sp.]MDD3040080.1 hypothetical protein [Bacteroides sp.]
MEKHKHKCFKINDDTMTTIVISSLLFCVLVIVVGILLACFQIDVSTIVGQALTVFGTELGICGVMNIFNKHNERQDALANRRLEARLRREELQNESK